MPIFNQLFKSLTICNLLIFTSVVLLSGWLGYYVDNIMPPQPAGETAGMALWLVLPLLSTLALRTFAGDGWKDIALRPRLYSNAKWYVVSFVIFPLVTAAILLIGWLLGWIDFNNFKTSDYFSVFAASLFPNFIKNIFEEFVWRGYLTSKLLQLKLNDWWLYLIVGAIWGAWHIPYYLFFLPEAQIAQILPVAPVVFALLAIVTMIFWTVMYVELYRITGSIWPAVILHMAEDSIINHLVTDRHITIAPGTEIFISPITGVLSMVFYLIVGLWLRKIRKGNTFRFDTLVHSSENKKVLSLPQ